MKIFIGTFYKILFTSGNFFKREKWTIKKLKNWKKRTKLKWKQTNKQTNKQQKNQINTTKKKKTDNILCDWRFNFVWTSTKWTDPPELFVSVSKIEETQFDNLKTGFFGGKENNKWYFCLSSAITPDKSIRSIEPTSFKFGCVIGKAKEMIKGEK
jgi:hypothetical protein